eukprot:scaffold32538_cov46-Attheya_sp.AAC.1
MPSWHWIPCIGGRSIRPILERIDFAVRHVSATIGDEAPHIPPLAIPVYSVLDCFQDYMENAGGIQKVGGKREYGGKAYRGTQLVHSLVTLGTPHGDAPGPAFESVKWCNQEPCPIRSLAVGATGTPGDSSGSLAEGAYTFCCPDVGGINLDGDGLTTTDS